MTMESTTISNGNEGSVQPLKSTAGEIRGGKSRTHKVLWLTITAADNEHFLHWLVGDHNLPENSRSPLTTSIEKGEWLFQSKEFKTWKTRPHSVLWLYGTAKSLAMTGLASDTPVTSHTAGSEETTLW